MASGAASENGKFELFYRDGWAHLAVRPPVGSGRPVYPEEIENRMRLLGVPRVGARAIRDLIAAADGNPAPLVEWPAGKALAGSVSVEVAEDRMSAAVAVGQPRKGAAPPSASEVEEALVRHGVVHGVDRGAVRDLLERRIYGKPTVVASGTIPVPGRGARVRHLFNANRGKPYLEMDFGRINLRELNFIENRKAGEPLAELEPPSAARDGRTVLGETIPAEAAGEDERLIAGANTRLSDDRLRLYAECDGNVRVTDGTILVEPVVTVRDVAYGTGNIRFDGSVVVEGGIADGFVVEAGGDIQVGSGVGKAVLKAGGNILLKTGINGNGEGSIECGGDLFAKYLESCSVVCGGNVFAEEAIMHSKVAVGRHCVLNGRRSEVIASDLTVGGSFWCKKLGNFNEAPTRVSVGTPPELQQEYRTAAAGLETRQTEWDKIEYRLEQIAKLIEGGRSDERLPQARAQLQAEFDRLGSEIAALRGRLPQLRERLLPSSKACAVVEEAMYKGVVVLFGTLEYRPPAAGIRKMVLRAGADRIHEAGFNHHERPQLDF